MPPPNALPNEYFSAFATVVILPVAASNNWSVRRDLYLGSAREEHAEE